MKECIHGFFLLHYTFPLSVFVKPGLHKIKYKRMHSNCNSNSLQKFHVTQFVSKACIPARLNNSADFSFFLF